MANNVAPLMSDIERGARLADEMHRASITLLQEKLAASEAARREAETRAGGFERQRNELRAIKAELDILLASERAARERAEARFSVVSPSGEPIDYDAWTAALDQLQQHREAREKAEAVARECKAQYHARRDALLAAEARAEALAKALCPFAEYGRVKLGVGQTPPSGTWLAVASRDGEAELTAEHFAAASAAIAQRGGKGGPDL